MGKYGVTVTEASPRRGKYGTIVEAVSADGDSSPAPEAPRAPSVTEDINRGVETAAIHAGRGLAGDWPARGAAALTATFGAKPEGESWGDRYDKAMDASNRVAEQTARERPVLAGTAELAGAVTPYIAGAGFIGAGGTLAGQAARAAGIAGLHGAATGGVPGAVQEAAFGAILPGMGAAKTAGQRALALATPAVLSAPTLVDSDASAKDKVVAVESALLPAVAHAAGSRGRAVPKLEEAAQRARGDVEPLAREALTKEAEALDQQRAQIDRQNEARVNAARAAEEQVASEDARDARTQTNDMISRRADAYDKQAMQARDELAAKRARDTAENTARRISGAQHAIEMIDARAEYARKMEAYNKAIAEAKDAQSRIKAEADKAIAVNDEYAKMTKAHESAVRDMTSELAELEEAQSGGKRSGEAAWAKLHQDAQAWISGYLDINKLAGTDPDPALLARAKKIAERLADTRGEWGASRVGEMESQFGKGRDQFVSDYAAKQNAEGAQRIDALESELAGMRSPTPEEAAQRVADKAKAKEELPPTVRATLLKMAEDAGFDTTNATDADLRAGRLPRKGGMPVEPAKPDDSAFQRGVQEMVLRKLRAEPEATTPALDPIQRRMLDRIDRKALADRLAELRNRTTRGAWRSDPGLILDKPDAMSVTDDLVAQRVADEVDAGRRNVRRTLTDEGVPENRSIANERLRERLARLIPDIPIGRGLRHLASRAVGPEGGVLDQYTRPERGAGLAKPSAYRTPAEAASIFADEAAGVGPLARALASGDVGFAGTATGVGSVANAALNDPELRERLRQYIESRSRR